MHSVPSITTAARTSYFKAKLPLQYVPYRIKSNMAHHHQRDDEQQQLSSNNNAYDGRAAYRTLLLLVVMGIFGLTISHESKDLRVWMPRSLSSASSIQIISISNTSKHGKGQQTKETKRPLTFAKDISCTLLPPSEDSSSSTEITENPPSSCVLFFPERFFATVANKFVPLYQHANQTVPTEHPVVHMTLLNNNASNNSASHYPSSITYLHIRKCGGTTMFRSLSTKSLQLPYKANKYNRHMIRDLGVVQQIYDKQIQSSSSATASSLTNTNHHDGAPIMNSDADAIVFSFVRDPVIRFLSSVGQMLHMGKIKLFPDCNESHFAKLEHDFLLLTKPNNTTIAKSQALVQCMLQSILGQNSPGRVSKDKHEPQKELQGQQHNQSYYNFIDQHLLPQAFELRARSLEYDIGIRLLDMSSQMSPTLKSLVGPAKQNRHARPSRGADYIQGQYVLEQGILTNDMILAICEMYAVDVLLLQITGVSSSLCFQGELNKRLASSSK